MRDRWGLNSSNGVIFILNIVHEQLIQVYIQIQQYARCIHYCIVLHCIVLYCIVLYCFVLFCKKYKINFTTRARYCIVLYCIVLYCIALFCIVLHCIVLCCIVL